ncbi:glycerate kinase, partial [Acinetobacter baumannii]
MSSAACSQACSRVITGEGKFDQQTLSGKTVFGV